MRDELLSAGRDPDIDDVEVEAGLRPRRLDALEAQGEATAINIGKLEALDGDPLGLVDPVGSGLVVAVIGILDRARGQERGMDIAGRRQRDGTVVSVGGKHPVVVEIENIRHAAPVRSIETTPY